MLARIKPAIIIQDKNNTAIIDHMLRLTAKATFSRKSGERGFGFILNQASLTPLILLVSLA
jgi:hypothetical protein